MQTFFIIFLTVVFLVIAIMAYFLFILISRKPEEKKDDGSFLLIQNQINELTRTLEAMLDGKSMTKHYVDRKAQRDETVYLHESLEPILKQTYGIIVYQEQAMKIATDIAGFSPEEADSLRKAMGKKDAALMKEVREKFTNGAKGKEVVDEKTAEQIFDWIQASARYSFNKSHAVAYAINSFRSAYCKAHDPIKFYETYLNHACHKPDKQKEIKELITDARMSSLISLLIVTGKQIGRAHV